MNVVKKETLITTSNEIAKDCENWLSQWNFIAPNRVDERVRSMRRIKSHAKTIAGIFVKPKLINKKTLYIFQGLKNKDYIEVFDPKSVIIVGSHLEKEYAALHGFGFTWTFPMEGAIRSKLSSKWTYPALKQLSYWIEEILKCEKVIIFLQEDTQPIGVFFVHLGRILPNIVTSVCIQHGMFLKYYYPIRCEGALSEINFVWDFKQFEVIPSNPKKTFEIGLSYNANAKPNSKILIILVGTGTAGSGSDIYVRSIKTYLNIKKILYEYADIKIFYRPHPTEHDDKKLIIKLKKEFADIDNTDKIQLLNGMRAIFIGVESSLLYEAGVAGHFVVHLKLDQSLPCFNFDFKFEEHQIKELKEWILKTKHYEKTNIRNSNNNEKLPLERFKTALKMAKLIEDEYNH